MGSTAARGAVITMGGQGARMIIQTLGVVILSRLLEPSEFGLFAMVLVIVGIGEVLRDFGLSAAVIQAREITREQQSNLFWINTAIGCALCAVLVVCSGLVADFYGEPDLAKVAVVVSAVFVMNGMSTQYRAALNRELRFTALAVSEVVSMGLGLIAGIGVAVAGFGVWALVVQQLVQAFAILAITVVCGRWVPGRPTLGADMKPLLTFVMEFWMHSLINYLSRNIDTIVIGRRFGTESLGFYNRAYQLLTLPLNQINGPATKVAFPVCQESPTTAGNMNSSYFADNRRFFTWWHAGLAWQSR
ncbi:oligosaccharide flippase family protein [Rhodococcus hoagii]|nr:oligosaccharide flippase family protein [Prescottella equi]